MSNYHNNQAKISVGQGERKSCIIGWIKADALPGQNEKARLVADAWSEKATC